MDVEGKMMEGELVERARARQFTKKLSANEKIPPCSNGRAGIVFKPRSSYSSERQKTVILAYEQIIPKRHGGLQYAMGSESRGRDTGSLVDHFSFHLQARLLPTYGKWLPVEQRLNGPNASL